MGEQQNQTDRMSPFGEIPDEYIDPEGEGELQDPSLVLESTADMRRAWDDWMCNKGPGEFANVKFFGRGIGGVPAPAVDAYKALEAALRATGYQPSGAWSYNCRKIANSNKASLHSYGVAIDIDSRENPQSSGDPYSGKIQKVHVDAVMEIRNMSGRRVWKWGGDWSTPDRMHFQLDQGPAAVIIDPSTVRDAVHIELEGVTHVVDASSLNMRSEPTLSGALIAGLPNGARVAVQSEPMQESDGYQWLKVEAVVGGQLLGGWVADKFLAAVGVAVVEPAPEAQPEPAIDGATHRVTATSLNLRSEPTTSGNLIISLVSGTEVSVQLDAPRENDDYQWVKVKAATGGNVEEGWVASKYLEASR